MTKKVDVAYNFEFQFYFLYFKFIYICLKFEEKFWMDLIIKSYQIHISNYLKIVKNEL